MGHRIACILLLMVGFSATVCAQVKGRVQRTDERKRLTPSTAPAAAEALRTQKKATMRSASDWLDLYQSERVARYSSEGKILDSKDQEYLGELVQEMESPCAGSLELAYAKWMESNYDTQAFLQITTQNTYTWSAQEDWTSSSLSQQDIDMAAIAQHTVDRNSTDLSTALSSLNISHDFSLANLSYHENVLHSAVYGAWIFTNGTDDTYPLLLAQYGGLRTDLHIIQVDWLRNSEYRKIVYDAIGVPANKRNSSPDGFIKSILAHGDAYPIYLALTMPRAILKKNRSELYAEGLLLKHAKSPPPNNIAATQTWWEQKADKSMINSADPINRNYVIPLALLNNYYRDSGQTEKAAALRPYFKPVAEKTGKKETVKRVSTY